MLAESADYNPQATVQPDVSSFDGHNAVTHVFGTCGAVWTTCPGAGQCRSTSICNRWQGGAEPTALSPSSGYLSDGSVPLMSGYVSGLSCARTIRARVGRQIELRFLRVELAWGDRLQVFDGDDMTGTLVTELTHETRGGLVVHSASRELHIRFETTPTATMTGRGFLAEWTSGFSGCRDPASPDYNPAAHFQPYGACGEDRAYSVCAALKQSVVSTAAANHAAADEVLDAFPTILSTTLLQPLVADGFIDSGSAGQRYVDGVQCSRSFVAEPGEGILLTFELVDLGLGDKLLVLTGNATDPASAVLQLSSQSVAPAAIAIDATHIEVRFETVAFGGFPDEQNTGVGFRSSFRFGVLGCTDSLASNYNMRATISTDTCDYVSSSIYSLCGLHSSSIEDSQGLVQSSSANVAPTQCQRSIEMRQRRIGASHEIVKLSMQVTSLTIGDVIAVYETANSTRASLLFIRTLNPDNQGQNTYVCTEEPDLNQDCGGQCVAELVESQECDLQCPSQNDERTRGLVDVIRSQGQTSTPRGIADLLMHDDACTVNRVVDFYSRTPFVSVLLSTSPEASMAMRHVEAGWTSGPAGCKPGTYSRLWEGRSRLQSEMEEDTCTPCPREAACLGNNECGPGYEGSWCAACKHRYFSFKSGCRRCPDDRFWLLCESNTNNLLLCCWIPCMLTKYNAAMQMWCYYSSCLYCLLGPC